MTPPPAFALPCWADDRAFYLQLPGPTGGEPVTIAYPLARALDALPLLRQHFKSTPRPIAVPARPVAPQSDAARGVLRRLGMIG